MEVYFLKRALEDQLRETEFWREQDPELPPFGADYAGLILCRQNHVGECGWAGFACCVMSG